MGFLSKITSLGKGLAKSALKNVGGALAGRAGLALGNKVNAVSSGFLARTSGILPAPGQALGQAQLSKLPGAKALAPLSSAAIKLTRPNLGGISNAVKSKFGR